MSKDLRKHTVKITFDNRERARDVIKVLGRCRYFPEKIPALDELTRLLRLPKNSISLALEDLEKANVIKPSQDLLGYHYNANPSESIAGEVGFFVNIDLFESWSSVFQDWLMGVNDIMSTAGYHIRVSNSFKGIEDKMVQVQQLWDRGVSGFVFASHTESPIREYITQANIPAVILSNATVNQQDIGSVSSDNRRGVEKMVSHLMENNHKRIFFYGSDLRENEGFILRMRAFEQSMRLAGLDYHAKIIFEEPYNPTLASKAIADIKNMDTRPTAVICASDREAFDLVSEFKRSGLKIPEDISVTGYANSHYCHVLQPAMTTINIHGRKMGQIAANYLLNELQSPQFPVKILVPTDLIIRESTAPLEKSRCVS
ncbi:MAG: substrate-binding domain-containing protein [Verrucomicrobiota bacterium]